MEQTSRPKILSGLVVRDALRETLKETVSAFSVAPKLVIIQVGEREDSNVYIKQKIKFGESIGVEVVYVQINETTCEEELKKEIEIHNIDASVSGIIVQLPLPVHISRDAIEHIIPSKDADCLTEYHQKKLKEGDLHSAPATASAVLKLLTHYDIPIKNKQAVVIGRSKLVGEPVVELLRLHGAYVSVIHRQTQDPKVLSRMADILVVAAGQPHLVTSEWVNPNGQMVVVDVGIHRTENGLVGDVDCESVASLVSALSPVPGGVGPLTVACLFEQVVRMHQKSTMV